MHRVTLGDPSVRRRNDFALLPLFREIIKKRQATVATEKHHIVLP